MSNVIQVYVNKVDKNLLKMRKQNQTVQKRILDCVHLSHTLCEMLPDIFDSSELYQIKDFTKGFTTPFHIPQMRKNFKDNIVFNAKLESLSDIELVVLMEKARLVNHE